MNPSCLVFDLGNVLWQLDYQGWFEYIHTYYRSITESSLMDFYTRVLLEADKRHVPDDEYLDTYKIFLGDSALSCARAYEIHIRLLAKGPRKAMSLLPALKKSYRLFLISNINPWHARYIEESYPSFTSLFEKRIYSFEEGVIKPSPDIFLHFQNLTHVDFRRAVFFDDVKANVDAGNKLGLESVLVENDDAFCSYLEERFLRGREER